ncbi:P-loop NTPase fold protein [Pigmentibacter ruber]
MIDDNKNKSSIKECFDNFRRLVSNDPPLLRLVKEKLAKHDGADEHKSLNYDTIKHQIDTFIRKNENLIFIIGPWGSGKTYLIEKYSNEIQADGLHFIKKSFFGITSLSEAYMHLLGFFKATFFLFMLYFIFYIFGFYSSKFFAPVFIIISLILLTNKFKLSYSLYKITSSLVDLLITSGFHLAIVTRKVLDMREFNNYKHKVYILDDLDHSSLKEEDRWALLANLWNYNTTYIVLLGYSENERIQGKNKFEIIELCEKLEGKIIFLPIAWERNEEIINHYLSQIFENNKIHLAFQNPTWLNTFTPRELINIADNFKIRFEEYQLRHKGYEIITELFFDCYMIRVFLENYSEKKNIESEKKIYLIKNTENIVSKEISKFYESVTIFFENKLFPKLENLNNLQTPYKWSSFYDKDELLRKLFLRKEEEMIKFFDDTMDLWIPENAKKPLT